MHGRRFVSICSSLAVVLANCVFMSFLARAARAWTHPSLLRRRSFSTQLLSAAKWKVGDVVFLPAKEDDKSELVEGVIQECRGAGWFEVVLRNEDRTIKCRGTQLQSSRAVAALAEAEQAQEPPPPAPAPPEIITVSAAQIRRFLEPVEGKSTPAPPTIHDLDAAVRQASSDPVKNKGDQEYLAHVANHMSYSKWIVFTDLHCAPSTLNTTLQVLHHIHDLARQRDAAVLFLGDFWHHRGTIRVDCLNAVLHALRMWEVPLVMIPGNHDQVTLGGHSHGLTPLQNAYRVQAAYSPASSNNYNTTTFPGPLIFSHPTKFANALLIPHIRDNAIMESVLRSTIAQQAECLFVHADVTGAYMNDQIISMGGVPPSVFPPHKPIYSGHFHKPHFVQAKQRGVSIEYLGSPYQVSLSEAQQDKALVVLDSSNGWKIVERIPLDLGRKHFRVDSLQDFFQIQPVHEEGQEVVGHSVNGYTAADARNMSLARADDRVVLTLDKESLKELRRSTAFGEDNSLVTHTERLRAAGVLVEVHEVNEELVEAERGTLDPLLLESMSHESTWNAFLDDQVRREALSNATAEELRRTGLEIIHDLDSNQDEFRTNRSQGPTLLELHSVSVEGFGPFSEKVTYPLLDRGLVLLRGTNRDGGSDSNGSGKTSLAASTLWVLTGSIDPRPLRDAKVSDVVNDSSKVARATVRGSLNGVAFSISRTKTASKGSLHFVYNGEDLTTQSVKETQVVIDEKLGISPQVLARTLFHGQHAMNELLEASDTKVKEELSLVTPLAAWQEASSIARKRARVASKRATELEGMITMRSGDLEESQQRLKMESETLEYTEASLEEIKSKYENNLLLISESKYAENELEGGKQEESLEAVQENLRSLETTLKDLDREYSDKTADRNEEIAAAQQRLAKVEAALDIATEAKLDLLADYESWNRKLTLAKEHVDNLGTMWNVNLELGVPHDFRLPSTCPTCQQSLSEPRDMSHGSLGRHQNHHRELEDTVRANMETAIEALLMARARVATLFAELKRAEEASIELEQETAGAKAKLDGISQHSENVVNEIAEHMRKIRCEQERTSRQLADAAIRIQRNARIQQLTTTLEAAEHRAQLARNSVEKARTEINKYETILLELRTERDKQESAASVLGDLTDAFSQRGVQTFVLQNAVRLLEIYSQAYLTALSDGCQLLELKLDSGDRISRLAFVRGQGGEFKERPLSSLSGGQWRRCSLALSFGFAELVAQRGNFRPSICILDEPLTHLDHAGRSDVGRVVRGMIRRTSEAGSRVSSDKPAPGLLFSTILMILQDLAAEELEEAFDRIDEVVKQGGSSHVVVDEEAVAAP